MRSPRRKRGRKRNPTSHRAQREERERLNSDFLDVSARKYTVIGNDVWVGANACVEGPEGRSTLCRLPPR